MCDLGSISGLFGDFSKVILSDPTIEEENLCTGTVTIVVNDKELCCVHKPGGSVLSEDDLGECIEKSKTRAVSVRKLIETAVKDTNKVSD